MTLDVLIEHLEQIFFVLEGPCLDDDARQARAMLAWLGAKLRTEGTVRDIPRSATTCPMDMLGAPWEGERFTDGPLAGKGTAKIVGDIPYHEKPKHRKKRGKAWRR